jgi:hypothetical protein
MSEPFTRSNVICWLVMTIALSIRGPGSVLFVFSLVLSRNQKTNVAQEKIYLASWLLSADNTTNARPRKAIGGRFYDEKTFV